MSKKSGTRYQCLLCSKMRDVYLDTESHKESATKSPNGLALYSDIHRCDEGILGINNLHIDANFATRSFSTIELPEQRKPMTKTTIPGLPGVPMARAPVTSSKPEMREYLITQMMDEKGFRLVIEDNRLRAIIKIGRFKKREKPIQVVESDQGSIILDYFPSEMDYNTNVDKWLHILVNQLELLPVTRMGLFIETLRFIHGFYRSPPDDFHVKQLQTILASHETYFEQIDFEESRYEIITAKYGDELTNFMKNILDAVKQHPKLNLKELALKLDRDLVYLIYTLLIMEQENLIIVQRPAMIFE